MDNRAQLSQQKILYKDECYAIQGALFEVYKELGHGFLESVYQECLAREFVIRNIPHVQQKELPIFYKGESVNLTFRIDFLCFEKILIELKAIHSLTDEHRAQVINYLKISGLRLGLLVNFGNYPRLAIERIIL